MTSFRPTAGQPLSPRETQVARLAADGLTNAEIARKLTISHRTADSHMGHIFAKAGVRNRVQLAAYLRGEEVPEASPLTCEFCKSAPAVVLAVVDVAGQRRTRLGCDGCVPTVRAALAVFDSAWVFGLELIAVTITPETAAAAAEAPLDALTEEEGASR